MDIQEKNLLAAEASPYLRQHAGNPVHWQPWSPATLAHARATDRPILLSIGYAACHWCHVMAHESFENEAIADLMNDLFVNIKVDREERPDIDQIFMAALHAMGEQGGWPLTMFLTPDGKPFWGGTYFPPDARYRRPGFPDVLRSVHHAWVNRRAEISGSADKLTAHVERHLSPTARTGDLSARPLTSLADRVSEMMDDKLGGLRGAPKFPNAPFMNALWLEWLATGNTRHRDQYLHSLKSMIAGGIYDHVGGGLARYSTDAQWIVPHFEKMLYDNAQLVRHLLWAWAETGDPRYRTEAARTLQWMDRDLTVASGGFASSLDADSEGEEGKFYTWTRNGLESILGQGTEIFLTAYELTKPDAWEGEPILNRRSHPDHIGDESESAMLRLLEAVELARRHRIPPGRDDKVLTDWNGLAIRAFAEAGRAFADPLFVRRAERAFAAILATADANGRLPHSSLGDGRLYPALSSDYASMVSAAVALHEATADNAYLKHATRWAAILDRHHGDGAGGHFLTADDAADVPMRIRGDVDDPIPSATAQIVEALTRLSSATGDLRHYDTAVAAAQAAAGRTAGQPYGQAGIIASVALAAAPMKLVIVENSGNPSLAKMASAMPDPRRVDSVHDSSDPAAAAHLPAGMRIEDAPAAWLCFGQTCLPPFRDPDHLTEALRARST